MKSSTLLLAFSFVALTFNLGCPVPDIRTAEEKKADQLKQEFDEKILNQTRAAQAIKRLEKAPLIVKDSDPEFHIIQLEILMNESDPLYQKTPEMMAEILEGHFVLRSDSLLNSNVEHVDDRHTQIRTKYEQFRKSFSIKYLRGYTYEIRIKKSNFVASKEIGQHLISLIDEGVELAELVPTAKVNRAGMFYNELFDLLGEFFEAKNKAEVWRYYQDPRIRKKSPDKELPFTTDELRELQKHVESMREDLHKKQVDFFIEPQSGRRRKSKNADYSFKVRVSSIKM